MEQENDKVVIADEDTQEEDFSPEVLENEETDWKAEAEKLKGIAKRRATALKKLKDRERASKTAADAAKIAVDIVKDSKTPDSPKTGELDETQLDYLDLKGITENEDIDVIQKVMSRTGMTLRQALKDDYVVSKLKDLTEARENKAATPTSTKRSGADSNQLEVATAKYERDGTLPSDFELRKQVVNAMLAKKNTNKPSWH